MIIIIVPTSTVDICILLNIYALESSLDTCTGIDNGVEILFICHKFKSPAYRHMTKHVLE